MAEKDIQVQQKRDLPTRAESTSGGPLFIPNADIFEDDDGMTLIIDMPGVLKEDVNIRLEEDQLSIYGKVTRPAFEAKLVFGEYRIGDYARSFILPETIDRAKIEANMKNGVLNLKLPKAEYTKPRQIEIKAG
jgi:HSP20 family protein